MQRKRACHHLLGAVALSAALLSGACANPHGLVKRGYEQPRFGLRIHYRDAAREQFIDQGWRIDNFYRGSSGAWTRKKGTDYYGFRLVEDERHGQQRKERAHFFELKLNHTETNGVIWVQTFKLPTKHKSTRLAVLLNNYVSSLSGSGLYFEGNIYGLQQIKVKKYAARIRQKRWIRVHQYNALRAKIDIVNLDRARLSSRDATTSIDVVLVRFWWTSIKDVQSPRNPVVWVKTKVYNPMMLVVGYKNRAAYFDKQRVDFDSFLRQIRFRDHPTPVLSRTEPVPPENQPPVVRSPTIRQRGTTPKLQPPKKKRAQPPPR